MKRLARCGCCMLLPLLILAGCGLFWFSLQLQPAGENPRTARVVIPSGATPREIARQLERQGLIRSQFGFLWIAARRGKMAAMKSGGYQLSPDMTLADIVDRLSRGGLDVTERTVTIPEGFTLVQISKTLQGKGIVTRAADFERAATTGIGALESPLKTPSDTLEGYLYPETYRLAPGTDPSQTAEAMLEMFHREFYEPNRRQIESSGRSLHELVTMASLIEREARVPKDRTRIAGVISNRLGKGMRLEIDATVLYALGRHKNRVLYKDLKVDSPYNTYRIKGLPPGPIASPGRESLLAALNPEKHDFLFYVAAPDGSHVFSRSMAEHSRNVTRMRSLRRSARP